MNDTRTRQRDGFGVLERVDSKTVVQLVLPLYYKKKNALFFISLIFAMVFAEFESKSRVRHVYTHL